MFFRYFRLSKSKVGKKAFQNHAYYGLRALRISAQIIYQLLVDVRDDNVHRTIPWHQERAYFLIEQFFLGKETNSYHQEHFPLKMKKMG